MYDMTNRLFISNIDYFMLAVHILFSIIHFHEVQVHLGRSKSHFRPCSRFQVIVDFLWHITYAHSYYEASLLLGLQYGTSHFTF